MSQTIQPQPGIMDIALYEPGAAQVAGRSEVLKLSSNENPFVGIPAADASDARWVRPELVGEVLTVMRELADGGTTMVVVTHEMQFAREVADQLVFLDDGQVAAVGTPAEVLGATDNERARAFVAAVL